MHGSSLVLSWAVLAACLSSLVSGTPLKRNLAYLSPSLTLRGPGLSHDVDTIGRDIVRRAVLRRRSEEHHPSSSSSISYAKDGKAAKDLVKNYDGDYGSDGRDAYKGKVTFPYGVAAGDPYDDSAILWTHPVPADQTQDPVCLHYQVSKDEKFDHIVDTSYAWTTSDVDYSFKVETTGLKPLTQYYYRFYACHDHSLISQTGAFKTIPTADDENVKKLKMAVFSCSNLPFGYFHAYRQAAQTDDVDLAVHVGDYLYESKGDGSKGSYGDGRSLNRVPEPNAEIFTLSDYRQRYQSYRLDKDLQALHQNKAWIHVWDDHEVADNSYNHGTADSNNTAAGTYNGTNFSDRKRNAVRAFFEWMPIRQVDTTDGLRIWRQFQYGKLADLFMLDTRNYDRDITDVYWNTDEIAKVANDSDRSLMGGKQERWFYKNLVKSQKRGATWKIVGQQIIVNHLNEGQAGYAFDYDAWDGYKANRRRMFDTIRSNNVDNTIFLAGDSHANWVYDAVYEEWENKTTLYDPKTGRGAIGVEFAGTAVSSPSSYGKNKTQAFYQAAAEKLVTINRNLQFAEGATRGYFTLKVTPGHAEAQFFGFEDITKEQQEQKLLATFHVAKGQNRLTRPINGGRAASSGSLQATKIDYSKQKWNGTGFN
jgi:alkaline phosphatase D